MLKSAVSIPQHAASYDAAANDWIFKFELVHTPLDEFLHEAQVMCFEFISCYTDL
jgi:hypothetical protein